ncbi:MAG: hypothetical protein GYA33_12330 [Thermogutta sp.]|nr:hypothetical protein [Thermogutta sp.]
MEITNAMSPPSANIAAERQEIARRLFVTWRELRSVGLPFDHAALLHEAKLLNLPREPAALADYLVSMEDVVPDGAPERDWRLFSAALMNLAADLKADPERAAKRSPRGKEGAAKQSPRAAETAAAAAEEPITRDVTCPECNTRNPARRNFCGHCGAGLWCICPGCQSRVPGDETFCGVCGYQIGEELSKYVTRMRRLLARAEELAAQGKPWDAAACLEQIPRGQRAWYEHARLLREVDRLQSELAPLLARRKAEIEAVISQAAEKAKAGDYEEAVRLLADLPRDMQVQEVRAALDQYRGHIAAISQLESELSLCLQKKDLQQTLNVIRQLLALKPQHAAARDVARKLQPVVKKLVERHVQNNRFAEALRVLEALPETSWEADLAALKGRLAGIDALVRLLRAAHYTYPYLGNMLDRLAELVPPGRPPILTEEEAAKLQAPIESPNAWARPVRDRPRSTLGPRVEWITRFRRLQVAETADLELLRRHPGVFLSAAGAALQGLDAAPLSLNLIPSDSRGLIGRLSRWLRPKSRSAWGVSFGGTALRAVRLEKDAASGAVTLTHLDLFEYEKPLSHTANRGQVLEILKAGMQSVFSRQEAAADKLILTFPPTMTVTTATLLPRFEPDQLETVLTFEAKRLLPDKGENMTWQFGTWREALGASVAESQTCVILGAMNRIFLNEALDRLRGIDVLPDDVTAEPIALLNWLLADYVREGAEDSATPSAESNGAQSRRYELPLLLVDLGSTASQAFYVAPGLARIMGLGIAGEAWTRTIAQQLKVTYAAADRLARDWRRIEALDRLLPHLEQFRRQAYDDMVRVLERLQRDDLEMPRTILVTGGGACIPGLVDAMIQGPAL